MHKKHAPHSHLPFRFLSSFAVRRKSQLWVSNLHTHSCLEFFRLCLLHNQTVSVISVVVAHRISCTFCMSWLASQLINSISQSLHKLISHYSHYVYYTTTTNLLVLWWLSLTILCLNVDSLTHFQFEVKVRAEKW